MSIRLIRGQLFQHGLIDSLNSLVYIRLHLNMLRYSSRSLAFLLPLVVVVLVASCASNSTITSRKAERASFYAGLSPEMKTFVDEGKIKVGMPSDAVYIAWGKPAEVLQNENEGGATTVWVYYGGWLEETRYWSRRSLNYDYQPRTYVRAEVVFVDGKVKSWQTLPAPAY